MPLSYLGAAVFALLLAAPAAALPPAKLPPAGAEQTTHIVAVVNGDVISNSDVDNRARLFALSTGSATDTRTCLTGSSSRSHAS